MTDLTSQITTRTVDGVQISATAAAPLTPLVNDVLDIFESKRDEWAHEFIIWFGWIPIFLVADGDDYVVTSYNLTGDNTTGTRSQDLTIALSTTALLAEYPRRCGLTPAEVYFNQDVIAARGWEESAGLQLDRSFVTNPDDSGWFIQPFPQVDPDREWQVDELTRLKVYEVLAARPAAAHVMGLPTGVVAVITDDNVRAIFNGDDGTILWDDRGD